MTWKIYCLLLTAYLPGNCSRDTIFVPSSEPQHHNRTDALLGPKYTNSEPDFVRLLGPSSYTILEGNELALICQGSPDLSLTWTKQNGLMPNGEKEVKGQQVIIQKVDREHAGTYRCGDSKEDSELFILKTVSVLYGPEIKIWKVFTHREGSVSLQLVCKVEANPEADLAWYRDQEQLTENVKGGYDQLVLTITGPAHTDLGLYTCLANNSVSTTYSSIHVTGLDDDLVIAEPSLSADRRVEASEASNLINLHSLFIKFVLVLSLNSVNLLL